MSEFVQAVSSGTGIIIFLAVQFLAMFIIPVGLPGTFVQVAAAGVMAFATDKIGWGAVALFLVMALIGEGIEFLSGRWGTRKFGGSSKAGWGALIGGIIGAIVGVPVPVIGSVIGAFLGTFIGAVTGEMIHQKKLEPNVRVGVGAVVGRAIAVAVKLSLAMIILILSIVFVVT